MLKYIMCGRYVFQPSKDFDKRFQIENHLNLEPNYNVSPGQVQPLITQNNYSRQVSLKKWGLIPSWSHDPRIGFRLINARADTINIKPSFRKPFKTQRCLIPASGFFEWQTLENKSKIPFYFFLQDQPVFSFAGIYEASTFTIITTDANDTVKKVHDRMPVILESKFESIWLDQQSSEDHLLSLLKPYPSEILSFYQVSSRLNKTSNNDPSLINPVKESLY